MTDPIADLLTRIRNGQRARKGSVTSPHSKIREAILSVMHAEGYIRGYRTEVQKNGRRVLIAELKYHEGVPVIHQIDRVSKPGRRVYTAIKDLKPHYDCLGISVLSTSKGVMSDVDARAHSVGGEVLCTVF